MNSLRAADAQVARGATEVKASDVPAFLESLSTWRFIPAVLYLPIAMSIPMVEIMLGAAWFLRFAPRLAASLGLSLVLVFSLVYSVHVLAGPPPDCGCLGRLLAYEAQQETALHVLGRNAILTLLLVVTLLPASGLRRVRRAAHETE